MGGDEREKSRGREVEVRVVRRGSGEREGCVVGSRDGVWERLDR